MGLPYLAFAVLTLLLLVWPTVMRVRNSLLWTLKALIDRDEVPGARQLKQCPGCAEFIQKESRICCFCEYRFDAQPSGGAEGPHPPER